MIFDNVLVGIIMLSQWAMFLVGVFIGMVLTILATCLGILLVSIAKKNKKVKKK